MKLFKQNFKFLTFTTAGFFYDLWGTITIALFYHPTFANKGMVTGGFYGTLSNPNKSKLYEGISLILAGFIFLLLDHQLDIYKPRRKRVINFWKITLILASLFLLLKMRTLPILLLYLFLKYTFLAIIILLLILLVTFFLTYKPKK